MSSPDVVQQSVRAGVFADMATADRAVVKLLANGFPTEQITVVCAGESNERHYRHFEKPNQTVPINGEVATGATLGAAAGGLAAIAIGLASGAVPLVIAGAAGMAGGGGMGGFMGAMMSKGVEDEFSRFFQDQLDAGRIIIVVDDHGPECEARLALASKIFKESNCLMVSSDNSSDWVSTEKIDVENKSEKYDSEKYDEVQESSEQSFPASDPPSYTPTNHL